MVVNFPGYLLLVWGWYNTGFVVFWGFAGWGFVVRCEGGGLGFCCALGGWWVLGL